MTEAPKAAPVDTEPRHQPSPPNHDKGEAAAAPRPEQPSELDSTQSSPTAPSQPPYLRTMAFALGLYGPKETTEKKQKHTPEGQSGVRPTPPPASDSTEHPTLVSPPTQQCGDDGGGRLSHGQRNPGRWKKGAGGRPHPRLLGLFDTEDP